MSPSHRLVQPARAAGASRSGSAPLPIGVAAPSVQDIAVRGGSVVYLEPMVADSVASRRGRPRRRSDGTTGRTGVPPISPAVTAVGGRAGGS